MDFEKIKEYLLENKKTVLLIMAIVVVFAWFRINNNSENEANTLSESNSKISQISKQSSNESEKENQSSSSSSQEVTCDIDGAVRHQGVYTLRAGARLQELIEAAGGLSPRAQLKAINRAIILKDQDKIHIPYKGEKVASVSATNQASSEGSSNSDSSNSSQAGSDNSGKINLNTASSSDLQKLNGVGEKKAEKIIAYRKQNGNFKKIEDLMKVSGIGEKTFATLKDHLAV